MRALDKIQVTLNTGRHPDRSTPEGFEAVKELEALVAPPDADAAVAALARAIDVERPEDPSVQEAARAVLSVFGLDEAASLQIVQGALEDETPSEDLELTEAEQEVARVLEERMRSGADALAAGDTEAQWPPRPPLADPMPEAQAARLPAVAALEKAWQDVQAGVGRSELQPVVGAAAEARSLAELLGQAGQEALASHGDLGVMVTGVADVQELVRPGDLAVLTLRPGPLREAEAREALAAAGRAGAVAAVCLAAEARDVGSVAEWLADAEGLQSLVLLSARDAAPRLASTFWGDPGARLRCFAVVGDDPVEVRTAAWLLSCAAESRFGKAETAALCSRRSSFGGGAVDVDRALTPCLVQELLAGAASAGAQVCVLEALPGAQLPFAFDGLHFECTLDLGDVGSGSTQRRARLDCREKLIAQTRLGGIIAAGNPKELPAKKKEKKRKAGKVGKAAPGPGPPRSFYLKPPLLQRSKNEAKGTRNDALKVVQSVARSLGVPDVSSELEDQLELLTRMREHGLGLPPLDAYASKRTEIERMSLSQHRELMKELDLEEIPKERKPARVQRILEKVAETDEELPPLPPHLLYGRLREGASLEGTRLSLSMEGCDTVEVQLPLLGMAGARAAVAAASAAAALRGGNAWEPDDMQWLRSALESAPAPPGTLEVLKARTPARAVAVLHEAQTPEEVRHALRLLRRWVPIFNQASGLPRITAVLGCPGEMRRGDRAKCGWALAELADCIVITSDQPRSELPMQIAEDILEAVRSRAPSGATSFAASPTAKQVHVVADRADAIKLGACLSMSSAGAIPAKETPPGLLVLFGSTHGDTQEAAGPDGEIRHWLCNDRRVALEALEAAERIRDLPDVTVDVSKVPWDLKAKAETKRKEIVGFPGASLHWTHHVSVRNDGTVRQPL